MRRPQKNIPIEILCGAGKQDKVCIHGWAGRVIEQTLQNAEKKVYLPLGTHVCKGINKVTTAPQPCKIGDGNVFLFCTSLRPQIIPENVLLLTSASLPLLRPKRPNLQCANLLGNFFLFVVFFFVLESL